MTVIIKHITTNNEYILLGTNLNDNKSLLSTRFLDNLFAAETDKVPIAMVAACDAEGKILWLSADEVVVVEVDGDKPSELLPPPIIVTPPPPKVEEEPENPPNDQLEEEFPEDEEWI